MGISYRFHPARQDPFGSRLYTPPIPLQIPQYRPPIHLGEHLLYPLRRHLPQPRRVRVTPRIVPRVPRPRSRRRRGEEEVAGDDADGQEEDDEKWQGDLLV